MASISSSKRVCSDCVAWTRIGGGGALRVFERRFLNNNGPIPVAEIKMLHDDDWREENFRFVAYLMC